MHAITLTEAICHNSLQSISEVDWLISKKIRLDLERLLPDHINVYELIKYVADEHNLFSGLKDTSAEKKFQLRAFLGQQTNKEVIITKALEAVKAATAESDLISIMAELIAEAIDTEKTYYVDWQPPQKTLEDFSRSLEFHSNKMEVANAIVHLILAVREATKISVGMEKNDENLLDSLTNIFSGLYSAIRSPARIANEKMCKILNDMRLPAEIQIAFLSKLEEEIDQDLLVYPSESLLSILPEQNDELTQAISNYMKISNAEDTFVEAYATSIAKPAISGRDFIGIPANSLQTNLAQLRQSLVDSIITSGLTQGEHTAEALIQPLEAALKKALEETLGVESRARA